MAYLVLARKYRPKDFESIVHQEHVTTTLKNAIKLERVAHAHIFTGPRGTGKTTIARILAKCMNCENGPTEIPCGTCRSCSEIASGNPSDVIEIDGASNNSVDQIREIRDNLQYKPSHSKYKIYIIDEVHMLSIAAFNALLKSLEEPPSHIMFLFATTEPHKVPVTIMSRCQRHDLKRVPLNILTDHLNFLCSQEGIQASYEGLLNIASAAEGSVRDSMSILDQVISSSSESEISAEHINWILGSSPFGKIKNTLEAIFQNNKSGLIDITSELYFSGTDLKIFYQDIIQYIRHCIILKIEGENGKLCDLPLNHKKELFEICKGCSSQYLTRLLDLALKEEIRVRQTDNTRIITELIFLKLSDIPQSKDINQILRELQALKNNKHNGYTEVPPVSMHQPNSVPAKKEADNNIYPHANVGANTKAYKPEPQPAIVPEVKTEKPAEEKKEIDYSSFSDNEKWAEVEKKINSKNTALGRLLSNNSELKEITDHNVILMAKGSDYHVSRLNKEKNLIEQTAKKIFGKNIKIEINDALIDDSPKKSGISEAEKLINQAHNHPLVMAVKNKLSAKVIDEKIIKNKLTKEESL